MVLPGSTFVKITLRDWSILITPLNVEKTAIFFFLPLGYIISSSFPFIGLGLLACGQVNGHWYKWILSLSRKSSHSFCKKRFSLPAFTLQLRILCDISRATFTLQPYMVVCPTWSYLTLFFKDLYFQYLSFLFLPHAYFQYFLSFLAFLHLLFPLYTFRGNLHSFYMYCHFF